MRLGFDVGGTKTDAVVVAPSDRGGADAAHQRILARVRRATGWGPNAVLTTILDAVDELAAAVGVHPSAFTSLGVGMPGQVAPGGAVVAHAVNLGIDELDLALALGPRLGIPVRAENDVKAAAVGAAALRGADALPSMAYLNLGTGIAAGFVHRGRLWRAPGAPRERSDTSRSTRRDPSAAAGSAVASKPSAAARPSPSDGAGARRCPCATCSTPPTPAIRSRWSCAAGSHTASRRRSG